MLAHSRNDPSVVTATITGGLHELRQPSRDSAGGVLPHLRKAVVRTLHRDVHGVIYCEIAWRSGWKGAPNVASTVSSFVPAIR